MPLAFDPSTRDGLGNNNKIRLLLHVDRYWDRKEQFPNGHCIEFAPFKVGDCSWRVCIYPNGASSSSKDYISIFIALDGRAVVEPPVVRARARFSLFDWDGKRVPGHSVDTDIREYSVVGYGYGFEEFIRRDFLEGSEQYLSSSGNFMIMFDFSVELCGLQLHLGDVLAATDVSFLVGGETFSAHRCVLAARSPAFEAELLIGATRGDCIQIDGMPAQVFKAFLHFVYTDSLPPEMHSEAVEQLLVAADRFQLQKLKMICQELLRSKINVGHAASTTQRPNAP